MAKVTVIITNIEKYKELTGLTKALRETADHNEKEIKILLDANCIEIPPLALKILEESKKKTLLTSDERGAETPEDIWVEKTAEDKKDIPDYDQWLEDHPEMKQELGGD